MAHRVLSSREDVREYEAYLDENWPERADIARHLSQELVRDGSGTPRVLELACGPGALAETILSSLPVREYVGVDIAEASLDYAADRLADACVPMKWVQADLNDKWWLEQVGDSFDAIVSMQSLHDLGGEPEIRRVFAIVHDLLAPHGRFVYADLLRQQDDPPDAHPGRFSAGRHKELLAQAGFGNVSCTYEVGSFGCFKAEVIPYGMDGRTAA